MGVEYRYRYVIDKHFLVWLIEEDKFFIKKLLRINKYSEDNKNSQILMLRSQFEELDLRYKTNNPIINGCICKVEDNDYISIHEKDHDKNIILAIDHSDEPPYKVVILTSPSKLNDYIGSDHFKKLNGNSISIKADGSALKILEGDFLLFHQSKSHN
jgi:hypothetical protein